MASGKTPLRGYPYPLETDVPDAAADLQALATSLDNAPVSGQGVLSARPASKVAGNRFYVSGDGTGANNGIEWLDTGNGWVAVAYPDTERQKNKGVASGYAPLDASAHVPAANLSGIPDTSLASPNNGARHLLLQATSGLNGYGPGDFMPTDNEFAGPWFTSGGSLGGANGGQTPSLFASEVGSDFAVPGKTFMGQVRMTLCSNSVAGPTIKGGAYEITTTFGGAGSMFVDFSAISGSQSSGTVVGSGGIYKVSGPAFTMPANQAIGLGVHLSAAQASGSIILVTLQLFGWWQ